MAASIRPLSLEDYEKWLPLWKNYQSFYETSIPDEVSRESFRRMLDPAEPTAGALAFQGESPIGMVHWIFHRSNWTIGDCCYLQDLYVSEKSRGSGVGRLLIEHVYVEARKAGSPFVYWLTHESNAAARLLYDRIATHQGFIKYRKDL
jgi:ribosomal protein S18 acetylase RimI-like enzyme